MITQMQNLTDAEHAILNQTWRGKKILSYLQAYGFDYEFCRSFRLTEGEKTGWMLLFNATLLICAEQPVALEETKCTYHSASNARQVFFQRWQLCQIIRNYGEPCLF